MGLKIKATGDDAKKVASAFHEIHANPPKILAHTARKFGKADADRQRVAIGLSKARAAGAKVPDKSGANFVSRNDLAILPGSNSNLRKGSERLPYKECPQFGKDESTGMRGTSAELSTGRGLATGSAARTFTKETISTTSQVGHHEGFGPSYVGEEILTVAPVNRVLNPVEIARRRNNASRDARTNLGRGKAGVVTAEDENDVQKTW
jgi:hypothetical protein